MIKNVYFGKILVFKQKRKWKPLILLFYTIKICECMTPSIGALSCVINANQAQKKPKLKQRNKIHKKKTPQMKTKQM